MSDTNPPPLPIASKSADELVLPDSLAMLPALGAGEIPLAEVANGPQVVDYAGFGSTDVGSLSAARWMVALAVLSGCCVASCFVALLMGMVGAVIHALVVAATLASAIVAEGKLGVGSVAAPLHRFLDLVAGFGLLGIGAAPLVIVSFSPGKESLWVLGGCFAMLAISTYRHRLQYQRLADVAAAGGGQSLPNRLRRLGIWKMLYEAAWLGCCALTLVGASVTKEENWIITAFAGFLGCGGFGIIWIVMIVYHAQLAALLRRNTGR